MRILEARDGFIKFESNEKLAISSFVEIEDIMKKYIAQIVRITVLEDVKIGYAKILYLYDGSLYEYDKTLPEKGATIKPFAFEIFKHSLKPENPIKFGFFSDTEEDIEISAESFDKKMLMSIDNPDECAKLVSNLKQEFTHKGNTLVIDMLGITKERKFTASVDFKLPLDTQALEFMYEECLNDATSDSKSLVKEIFTDLAEYSKSVPFLPFATLKTIVDDMVTKSHIFKLLVLKNKLTKFDRDGYFAATVEEAHCLNKIIAQKEAIIDLSKLDANFQNRYLSTIFNAIAKLQTKPQIFIIASNAINKKNLKTIILNQGTATTFITHSRFKYINEIKGMFNNFVIEPTFNNNEVFKTYKTFLEGMKKNALLVVGECTNYIPLVVDIKERALETAIIEIDSDDNDNIEVYTDLEKALENEPKDPQTEAIDKKSEDLIEKITERLDSEASENINIFASDEDEEEDEAGEDNEEDINEFSTTVHPNVTMESDDTITEETTNTAIEDFENEDSQETLEATEDTKFSFAEDSNTETSKEEEIIELEIPEDISDFADGIELDINSEPEIEEAEKIKENDTENAVYEQITDITEYEAIENESLIQDEDEISEINEDSIPLEFVENKNIDSNEDIVEIADNVQEATITEVIPFSDEEAFDEIIELDENEINENDIIVDFNEDEIENSLVDPDALDKEIAKDVDKVFTTMKEDTISDSDLDFIDELNEEPQEDALKEVLIENEFEELPELKEDTEEEQDFIEPLEEFSEIQLEDKNKEILQTKNTTTPIVPVYDAEIPQEDTVDSDIIEQGDTVVHAKYGNGIVEKMIKYGSKTLYSINFDNVGRRLLDPNLTELKKS